MQDDPQNAQTILDAINALRAPQGIGPFADGQEYANALGRGTRVVNTPLTGVGPLPSSAKLFPEFQQQRPRQDVIGTEIAGIVGGANDPMAMLDAGPPLIQKPIKKEPEIEKAPEESTISEGPVRESAKQMIDSMTDILPEQKEEAKMAVDAPPAPETPSSSVSPMQKLAMIAMAIAPTVIGYAAAGKKGAYLGAASTGKGLAAGLEQKGEEDKFEFAKKKQAEELALARERAKGKEAGAKADRVLTDEQGYMFFQGEDNQVDPVINPRTGQQMREANVPLSEFDPKTGKWLQMKQKFELPQGTQAPGVGIASFKNMYDSVVEMKKSAEDKRGKQAPEFVLKSSTLGLSRKYPYWSPDNPTPPPGFEGTRADWDAARLEAIADYNKINSMVSGLSTAEAKKKEPQKQPSLQERAEIDLYKDEVKKWADKDWREFRSKQANAENFFNQDLSKIKSSAIDPALWFEYMKSIQQDNSVIREGDVATAMRFMATKTRIDSWLTQYGPQLGSAMTEEMRRDMIDYLKQIRGIKERLFMMDVNGIVRKGNNLGFKRPQAPQTAIDEAKSWSIKNGVTNAPLLGMAAGTTIWNQRVSQMIDKGELKNGQFVKDTDGRTFLVKFTARPDGKIGKSLVEWVIK